MTYDSVLTGEALAAYEKALPEGRLWWRVGDQYGRACNGGSRDFRLDPALPGVPGAWSPRVEHALICESGYHVTSDPLHYCGQIVSLVEVDEVADREGDKAVCHTMRELGRVVPWECLDDRILAACVRPMAAGANLTDANLTRANLAGAYLAGANLARANLTRANLTGADFAGANLARANLTCADLTGANLTCAYLAGADFTRAIWYKPYRGPNCASA